jgi:hypothetical protein
VGNLWPREGRCQVQKAFSDARNVSKTKWFLLNQGEAKPPLLQRNVHVVVGLRNFSPLLFETERSFGNFQNHRQYENMFLNNFLISIFRIHLTFNQDKPCPEIGKMI